ncbi:hypothetical protein [Emticicia fontis]
MVQSAKKTTELQPNELRAVYDNAKKFYSGLVTTWKKDFISNADYQAFLRTYSFCPINEVPPKFTDKVTILRRMIDFHAQLVRETTQDNSKQLKLPML